MNKIVFKSKSGVEAETFYKDVASILMYFMAELSGPFKDFYVKHSEDGFYAVLMLDNEKNARSFYEMMRDNEDIQDTEQFCSVHSFELSN